MYFHAPRGVVLYFVGCKLYTDKEKKSPSSASKIGGTAPPEIPVLPP